jgi:hypothetical protein
MIVNVESAPPLTIWIAARSGRWPPPGRAGKQASVSPSILTCTRLAQRRA